MLHMDEQAYNFVFSELPVFNLYLKPEVSISGITLRPLV